MGFIEGGFMEKDRLKAILEALLFASSEPLGLSELKRLLQGEAQKVQEQIPDADPMAQLQKRQEEMEDSVSQGDIKESMEKIVAEYNNHPSKGIEVVSVAKGFQMRTKASLAPFIRKLFRLAKPRLSTPGMETLAIVAYQQPVTRAKIETIRGVDSGGVLKTLLDRDLVRIVGRSEEAGRPILYGTTLFFLETFGLQTLSELPTLKDLESLSPGSMVPSGTVEEPGQSAETQVDQEAQSSFESMDQRTGELIEELENSMRNLKDLERDILGSEEGEKGES